MEGVSMRVVVLAPVSLKNRVYSFTTSCLPHSAMLGCQGLLCGGQGDPWTFRGDSEYESMSTLFPVIVFSGLLRVS